MLNDDAEKNLSDDAFVIKTKLYSLFISRLNISIKIFRLTFIIFY